MNKFEVILVEIKMNEKKYSIEDLAHKLRVSRSRLRKILNLEETCKPIEDRILRWLQRP